MNITEKDLGRKVRLRNGREGVINEVKIRGIYPVLITLENGNELANQSDGLCYEGCEDGTDIIAFLDDEDKKEPTKTIDWEQRQFELFKEVVNGVQSREGASRYPDQIMEYTVQLINEYKKQLTK